MPVILATTSSFASQSRAAADAVTAKGFDLVTNPHGRKLTEAELLGLMAEHRPLGLLAGTEPVTAKVLEASAGHLKAVARIGVGWDNVDHEAARRLGVPVSRTPGVLNQAVAELVLGMVLSGLRHVATGDRDIRTGVWKKRMGGLLAGKTLGVVGFGGIGHRVGELAAAFGATVVYCDLEARECSFGEACTLDEVLERADVVSLHAAGDACILDRQAIGRMRPGAMVVNTARGGMVDEDALFEALADGRLGFACLDVFAREPYDGPLKDLDNVILTPHVGSYAREARIAMEEAAVANLFKDLSKIGAL